MYLLQCNINGKFCCWLQGKKKSNSKFRKFDIIETRKKEDALLFEKESDAIAYKELSPTTVNFFPVLFSECVNIKIGPK